MTTLLISAVLIFAMSCSVQFPGGAFARFLWRLGSTVFFLVVIAGLTILI